MNELETVLAERITKLELVVIALIALLAKSLPAKEVDRLGEILRKNS